MTQKIAEIDMTLISVEPNGCGAIGALGIVDAAQRRLGERYAGLRHIVCEFQAGILTLRGIVASYFLKQMAQTAVRGVDGVHEIVNRVQVHHPEELGN